MTPVDPPETERLVDSVRVGDALVRGVDLVERDDELGLLVVVLLEPRTQRGGRPEELRRLVLDVHGSTAVASAHSADAAAHKFA